MQHYGKEYVEKLYIEEPHGWYRWRPASVEDSLGRVGDFLNSKILMRGGR